VQSMTLAIRALLALLGACGLAWIGFWALNATTEFTWCCVALVQKHPAEQSLARKGFKAGGLDLK
jgi:hypothetical protein